MTRNYKTNWQGKRNSTRFHVTFDAPKIASEVKEACTICGGKIEEVPMMRGVCYSCYRDIIGKEEHKALKIVLDVTAPKLPPAKNNTLQSFAENRERQFNQFYYGNKDGLPYFPHQTQEAQDK